jgi:hypothetical protein
MAFDILGPRSQETQMDASTSDQQMIYAAQSQVMYKIVTEKGSGYI